MTNLMLRDKLFQDLFDFRRDFDQIFNRMLIDWPWVQEKVVGGKSINFLPPVESFVDKEGKKFFLRVLLPGIDPKDVKITAQGELLTISGERKYAHTKKEVDYLDEEIAYGTFERTLTLPEGVNIDKLVAEYHDGLLEITAPVSAAALPRRVEIKTVPMAKPLAA